MHEDSKKKQNDIHTNESLAPSTDETIARITAELLHACDSPAMADAHQQGVSPVQAHGEAVQPKVSAAMLDAAVKQAMAVHSIPEEITEEEVFRAFFTNTAVVVPKEMQAQKSAKGSAKKSVFTRLQGLFAHSAQLDEEEDEDEGLFFPVKAEDSSADADLFAADAKETQEAQGRAKPKGKVHFVSQQQSAAEDVAVQPAPVHQYKQPVDRVADRYEADAPTPLPEQPALSAQKQAQQPQPTPAEPAQAVQLAVDPTEVLLDTLRADRAAVEQHMPAQASFPKSPAPMEDFFTAEEWAQLSHTAPAPAKSEAPVPASLAQEKQAPVPEQPVQTKQIPPAQEAPVAEDLPGEAAPIAFTLGSKTPLQAEPETNEMLAQSMEQGPDVLSEERPFGDLSQETAFLREACEQQTEPKEPFFTRVRAKVQAWKAVHFTKRLAAASLDPVDQALQEAESDFFVPMEETQDALAAEQHTDEAQDMPALALQQQKAPVDAADTAPQIAQQNAMLQGAQEIAVQTTHATNITQVPEEPTPAEQAMEDDMFVSLQSAFSARVQQEKMAEQGQASVPEIAPAQDEAPVPEITLAQEETPVLEEAFAQEVTAELEPSLALEMTLTPQEADDLEITLTEEEPFATIAQESDAQSALQEEASHDQSQAAQLEAAQLEAAQPEQAPQKPSEYCLFDQAADEVAAEAQIGWISFVDAVPFVASASVAAQAFAAVQASADADADGQAPTVSFDWADAQAQSEAAQPTQGEGSLLDDTRTSEDVADAAPTAPPVFEDAPPAEKHTVHEPLPEDPEGIQFGLSGMRVRLLVRTFTTGVFAAALFLLGLMAQGVLPAVDAIDPAAAPVPFLLVNLALMLAAAGVSYPVFIDGVTGLWRKPSPDTLPALAGVAALLQLLLCLAMVESYQPASITLFSALAGLALFADALGSLVMAMVMQSNFNLASAGVPHYLAYHLRAKDAQRTLTRGLEVDDPALLLSRPVQQIESFLDKSFSPRASDKRAQWAAYGLLGAAVLAFLVAFIKGQGALGAVSSFAGVLCVGVPLSVTLLAALPSVFLQRAAAKVGAVVPGWQSIEALGDINLIAVDGADLFPPMCAQMYGIKPFQKERVDLAILYATSILVESCDTLQNLFASMIDYKTDLLYPVKDLAVRGGLGFIGWCENYRIILGTRALMQAEGVPVPALDYENRYTKEGKRQVLYLSVSGQLYAMFIVGYRGEKNIARALRVLRKEHIRLLVRCSDPTLTAHRMEEIYRLPAGFITLLSPEQSAVMQSATDYRPKADGCMLHLGNFASLVGGLKAASGAAQVERSASAIQLVWAGFSAVLCLFLCLTDGLMQVPRAAILLYQMAWCVINLGVVFTKKFE